MAGSSSWISRQGNDAITEEIEGFALSQEELLAGLPDMGIFGSPAYCGVRGFRAIGCAARMLQRRTQSAQTQPV